MIFNKTYLLCILGFLFIQCKQNNYREEGESYYDQNGYADGIYCAEIDYYYSETGTSSTYTLEVEIENNELILIHWPNGGWLDDSHFSPPDISSGEATFTSDKGVDYTVKIIGEEGDCTTSSYVIDQDDLIQQKEEEEFEDGKRQEEEEAYRNQQQEEQELEPAEERRQEDTFLIQN